MAVGAFALAGGLAAAAPAANAATDPGAAILAWGGNGSYQLGDGTKDEQDSPVHARLDNVAPPATFVDVAGGDDHSLALTTDGRVYAWGANDLGQLGVNDTSTRQIPAEVQLPGGASAIAIAAGNWFSVALASDGSDNTVYVWGSNQNAQLGGVTFDLRAPSAADCSVWAA